MSQNNAQFSSPHLSHLTYRPDIDGLRALAVLSVIGFHAFPAWIHGGFIGVDVFFVISGFLISGIIFRNLDKGTFTFAEFYIRRIVRIFPALILVMAATYAFGWFSLLGDEYKELAKHIAGGAAFVSNFLLWQEAGYFDTSSDSKPLLHLWSLGIEEQFYIFWPLLVWVAWKRKFNLLYFTLGIALLSFYLNLTTVGQDAEAAFYSPQTRFWELMCGGLLAWVMIYKQAFYANFNARADKLLASALYRGKPAEDGATLANLSSLAGLALLALGLGLIAKNASFPGGWAMFPVLAAVLMIAAGPGAWVNRNLLSNKVLVWIGLISYPLYLWHWPLLSYARILGSEAPSEHVRLAAIALSLVLAWLTYRLAEHPVRAGRQGAAKAMSLAALMAILGCMGYYTFHMGGMRMRQVLKMNSLLDSTVSGGGYNGGVSRHMIGGCGLKNEADSKLFGICQEDGRGGVRYALMGDSKAGALYRGLVSASTAEGRWLVIGGTSKNGAPVPLLASDHDPEHPLTVVAVNAIAENRHIDTVVLVTAIRAIFGLNDKVEGPNFATYDHTYLKKLASVRNFDTVYAEFNRVVSKFVASGKKVVLVVDNPALPSPQDCINRRTSLAFFNRAFSGLLRTNPDCYVSVDVFNREIALYRELLTRLQKAHPKSVDVFDPTYLYCDRNSGTCGPSRNGRAMYSVTDHISDYAASLVGRRLTEFLQKR